MREKGRRKKGRTWAEAARTVRGACGSGGNGGRWGGSGASWTFSATVEAASRGERLLPSHLAQLREVGAVLAAAACEAAGYVRCRLLAWGEGLCRAGCRHSLQWLRLPSSAAHLHGQVLILTCSPVA